MMSGTEKTCIFFTFFGLNVQIQEKFITWDIRSFFKPFDVSLNLCKVLESVI